MTKGDKGVIALVQRLLSKGNQQAAEQIVSAIDDTLVEKAVEKAAQMLKPHEMVPDLWEEGRMHGAITREEVKVGMETAATGSETQAMNREYSNNAQQHGVQLSAEKLMRHLSSLGAASKAQFDTLNALLDVVKAQQVSIASMTLAKAGEDEDEEEDEESEVVEIKSTKKAKSLIEKAKDLLSDAKVLTASVKAMEEDDEDEEKCKAARKAARKARKDAAVLLGKARTLAYAARNTELKKSIRIIAAKADIDVVEEEEEEDDEKAKARTAEIAAAKAKDNDKGHQADHEDPATGNQAATAKADVNVAAIVADQLKPLSLRVDQMFDVLMGKSRIATAIPEAAIRKAADNVGTVDSRIAAAIADGSLEGDAAVTARSLASALRGAKNGNVDISIIKSRIDKAPSSIRKLFAEAVAA